MLSKLKSWFPWKYDSKDDDVLNSQAPSDIIKDTLPSGRIAEPVNDECTLDVDDIEIRPLGQRGEYVQGKWNGSHLHKLKSIQFFHPSSGKVLYLRKHLSGYLLIVEEEDFVAKVQLKRIKKINFSRPFTDVKREVLQKMEVTEIINDGLNSVMSTTYVKWKQLWERVSLSSAVDVQNGEDAYQLSQLLNQRDMPSSIDLLKHLCHNKHVSPHIRAESLRLLDQVSALRVKELDVSRAFTSITLSISADLEHILNCTFQNHRKAIMEKYVRMLPFFATDTLKDHIQNVDNNLLIYVGCDDMLQFDDLAALAREEEVLLDFLCSCWDIFFRKVQELQGSAGSENSLRDIAPMTHPMYYYLFKSFKEIMDEICMRANVSAGELLLLNGGQWELPASIVGLQRSPLDDVLERQYRFIFKLMKHFQPGLFAKRAAFTHEFRALKDTESDPFIIIQNEKFVCGYKKTLENCLVWMSVLDDALAALLSKDHAEIYAPLLKGYMDIMKSSEDNLYTTFREATHNTARFIAQTQPYLSKGFALNIDREILFQQFVSFKEASSLPGMYLQGMVDVLIKYWQTRESVIEKFSQKFPYKPFVSDLTNITDKLLKLAHVALSIRGEPQSLIRYVRSLVEFLEDLWSVRFDWYVKGYTNVSSVQMINESKNSCKVNDPEEFVKECRNVPPHYVIQIVEDLLNIVRGVLTKTYWTNEVKLTAGTELLSAMRKSLVYLKDQPDYVSFDSFRNESTLPFKKAVEGFSSLQNFVKRMSVIGDSFWYIRKQDELNIDTALELYNLVNDPQELTTLRACYDKYLQSFNGYIEEAMGMAEQERAPFIASGVRRKLQVSFISEWTEQFKREALPEILAGIAAAWSVRASVDISEGGKSLKPHCMQVLCVLRLLCADSPSKGVENHLVQVLTGQGKSVVLGILSVLLALTGHRVRVACYSAYLAARDQKDFLLLFELFQVNEQISYGTFEEMANEVFKVDGNGTCIDLRELVKELVVLRRKFYLGCRKQRDVSSTVLLIDEVDVFFSEEFYGSEYSTCKMIKIPGLGEIQEKIWDTVKSGNQQVAYVLNLIQEFIKTKVKSGCKPFHELDRFLSNEDTYSLLDVNGAVVLKEYTNASLFKEHLEEMVNDAMLVVQGTPNDWYINRYKINEWGIILYRGNDGVYSNAIYGYRNVFNYFRLKKRDFDTKYLANYGYLLLDCGRTSYAKLPEEYPLILGVSGTLSALHEHEDRAVREHYGIRKFSFMPSFFGQSNLRFSPYTDVTCEDSEEAWLRSICGRASRAVEAQRAVLVFFDTEVELDKFRERWRGRFDRLRVLTVNSGAAEMRRGAEEAGVARTVTLLTRGLGRGVDFQSSASVERVGGVHVVQTFFSLDVKEETQIKGRTARKDNGGSYELLLCRQHLRRLRLLDWTEDVSYASLHRARLALVSKLGLETENKLKKCEQNHSVTMAYFDSFFEGEDSYD